MTAERVEGVVQVAIMLAIGAMAGAASFTHVHDVTVAHGQPNWIGWANAVVVELMSIALGLELRRRARTHRPTAFVGTALLCFVAVSLAAQVVEAERSIIGWLAAALPAIGFLVLVKVVLSRTAAITIAVEQPNSATQAAPTPDGVTASPTATPSRAADLVKPVTDQPDDQVDELVDEHATDPAPAVLTPAELVPASPATVQTSVQASAETPVEVPTHLLPTARFAVVNHEQSTGRPITRDELATRMSITPVQAGQLLHAITGRTDTLPQPGRINGTPIGATPVGDIR